ncbi:MAG: hypothetical protein IKX14_04200 [Neisseriaceae bacterium]|nr:hypothetical protein [Neisseriaceae bacterium]
MSSGFYVLPCQAKRIVSSDASLRYIVNSYQNYTSLARLAVLLILSAARRLVYFWSELTIIFRQPERKIEALSKFICQTAGLT